MIERLLLPLAAIVSALCLVLAGYEHLQAERVRTQLNNLRIDVAESTKRQAIANQRETGRRLLRQIEVTDVQLLKTQAAEAAADRTRTERDGLRSDLAAFVARAAAPDPAPDPAAPGQCPPAAPAVAVLARLLDRSADEREELARFADRAWIAGEACQRSYDALTAPNGSSGPAAAVAGRAAR